MTAKEIIIKWDLSRAFLASKMGMTRGTFHNKLTDKDSHFTPQEQIKLRDIIIEMGKDIDGIDAVDFEETMKQVF